MVCEGGRIAGARNVDRRRQGLGRIGERFAVAPEGREHSKCSAAAAADGPGLVQQRARVALRFDALRLQGPLDDLVAYADRRLVAPIPYDARRPAFADQRLQGAQGILACAHAELDAQIRQALPQLRQALVQPPARCAARLPASPPRRARGCRQERRASRPRRPPTARDCRRGEDPSETRRARSLPSRVSQAPSPAQSASSAASIPQTRGHSATIRDDFYKDFEVNAFIMSDTIEAPVASEAAAGPSNHVETAIIGAGPVGIFQIFELGLLGIGSVDHRFAGAGRRPMHRALS